MNPSVCCVLRRLVQTVGNAFANRCLTTWLRGQTPYTIDGDHENAIGRGGQCQFRRLRHSPSSGVIGCRRPATSVSSPARSFAACIHPEPRQTPLRWHFPCEDNPEPLLRRP